MQEQLKLWPPLEDISRGPGVWETLTAEERARVMARLARVLGKTIHPEADNPIQENKHEP